jgi:hypothetical protein
VGIEGDHVTDQIKHPPSASIGEAASLFYLLGGMAATHLVIVGGLVPPLLVAEAADAHIGSADIDLCLSLAITQGATREYYESIEEILEPYFELERASEFRWRRRRAHPACLSSSTSSHPPQRTTPCSPTVHARLMKRPRPRTRVHACARSRSAPAGSSTKTPCRAPLKAYSSYIAPELEPT